MPPQRLPNPGGDDGNWGDILNGYLSFEHNSDGTHKPLPQSKITGLETVLATKAADSTVVHNIGNETIGGIKTFGSPPVVPNPTQPTHAAHRAYVDGVAIAGAAPADANTKGIIKLTGDLDGTADLPGVAKINGVAVTTVPGTGNVLEATSASAATWQVPSGQFSGVQNVSSLPAAGKAGLVVTLSTGRRGLWVDTGTNWVPIDKILDPRLFGAKCDDINNDLPAYNLARDVLVAAGGGTIMVPEGTSRFTGTFSLASNVNLIGTGRSCKISADFADGGSSSAITVDAQSASKDNITISNFQVYSKTVAAPLTNGIALLVSSSGTFKCSNIWVTNCYVHDFREAGILSSAPTADTQASQSFEIHFDHNWVTKIGNTAAVNTEGGGGIITGANGGSCNNNQIELVGESGQDYWHGIYASKPHYNFEFIGNSFRNCWDAIHLVGSTNQNVTIAQNRFFDPPTGNTNQGYVFSADMEATGFGLNCHSNIVDSPNPMDSIFQFGAINRSNIRNNIIRCRDSIGYRLEASSSEIMFDAGVYHNTYTTRVAEAAVYVNATSIRGLTIDGGRIYNAGRGVYMNSAVSAVSEVFIRNLDIHDVPNEGIRLNNVVDGEIIGGFVQGAAGVSAVILDNCTRVKVRGVTTKPASGLIPDIDIQDSAHCHINECITENGIVYSGTISNPGLLRNHVGRAKAPVPTLLVANVNASNILTNGTLTANIVMPARTDSFILNMLSARSIVSIAGSYEWADGVTLTFYHNNANVTWVHNAAGPLIMKSEANTNPIAGKITRFLRINGSYYEV